MTDPSLSRPYGAYFKSLIPCIPALALWFLANLFLVPKAKTVCEEAGLYNAYLRFVTFIDSYGLHLIVIVIFLGLGLCHFRHWQTRGCTNTGILIATFITGGMLASLASMVICVYLGTPAIVKRSYHYKSYLSASGTVIAAHDDWRNRRTGISPNLSTREFASPEDIPRTRQDSVVNALLQVLESGATPGVRRGTVGTLIRLRLLMDRNPDQGQRFLKGLENLTGQRFGSLDEAESWFATVASDPEWTSVPLSVNFVY